MSPMSGGPTRFRMDTDGVEAYPLNRLSVDKQVASSAAMAAQDAQQHYKVYEKLNLPTCCSRNGDMAN